MSVIGNTAISFSEEQAMLLDVAREFCREKSPMPAVRAQLETEHGFDPALWDEMVSLGWAGIALPEASGGSAMGVASRRMVESDLSAEAVARRTVEVYRGMLA